MGIHKTYRQTQKGFTIIEVLIVLAIAGLIMLIVFLAVPALQRNNRNTQRLRDVERIFGGINEYMANNTNTMPESIVNRTEKSVEFADDLGNGNKVEVKLGFYDGLGSALGRNYVELEATSGGAVVHAKSDDHIVIVPNGKCAGAGINASYGGPRSLAIMYVLEDNIRICKDY